MRDKINEILNLIKANKFVEAESKCEEIKIKLDKNVEFLHIYGFIFLNLKKYDKAINVWKKAIKINPEFVEGLNNLGNAFLKIKKFDEAIEYLNDALKLKPDFFETYYTLSEVFFHKAMYEASLKNLDKALNLKPDHLPTINNKIKLLLKMSKKEDALKFLDKVIPYHPKNSELYNEKAEILSDLGMNSRSLNTYKTILMIDPNYPFVLGKVVDDKLKNCDWNGLDKDCADIKKKIIDGKKIAAPFLVSTLFDSSYLQNKSAEIWIKQFRLTEKKFKFQTDNNDSKRNIGYFSADFRDHPVGHLISKMLESHDKTKFNIYGFYLGNKHKEDDRFYKRIKKTFTKFYDVSKMSDEEIISLSINLKIHIAVDLMVYTGSQSRFGIFLNKCAPIQINFLGYPGTSASEKIDYIIADKTVIPETNKKFFTEKIIYFPNSYQPSEKNRQLSEKKFTKKNLNLPEDVFIFCCFNTCSKILPGMINVWADILNQVPKSILWMISDNEVTKKNLNIEFEKKNIDTKKIIFSDKLPISEHLARIKYADLFLDTFPYNAHTSCSDSIWAGLPLLTIEGNSFQSRVASSLLRTSGLEELVTKNEKEYIEKAVYIAKNKDYLDNLKNKLINSRNTNPLFDNQTFIKDMEKAYSIVLEKYFKNQKPEDIYL
tara:strand:- start:2576 stop:4549 length:1974 start_codon:yes stop_codon:yes gene_type:complete